MSTKPKTKGKAKAKSNKIKLAADAAKSKAAAKKAKAQVAAKEAKEAGKKSAAKAKALVKAKAAAQEKAKHTAALRKLDGMADDINARIAKVSHYSDKAEDHQLGASLQLEVARRFCADNNIPWQKWCEKNIKEWAVDTIRKMIGVIKGAKDIAEAQKMITDQRKKEAAQVAKGRKRKKAKADEPGTRMPAGGGDEGGPKAPKKSDFTVACEYLAGFDDRLRGQILDQAAGKRGMVVIPAEELKALRAKGTGKGNGVVVGVTPQEVLTAFHALKDVDKVMFVKKAADFIGFDVEKRSEDKTNLSGNSASMRRAA